MIAVDIDGIMVMVNTPACRMFGWKKADMLGRNVNMLMPAPLAAVHNSYLKNPKMDKGQERHLRDVIGLHREGYGVSVSIAISKTVQGKRTTYIGVLRPKVLPQAWTGPSVMSLWLAPNSTVIAGDANFCTATGYTATELHACATSTIMDAATAERIIDESMEKGIKGSTSGRPVDLSLIPKGAGRAPLLCTGLAYLGGTAKTRALMLVLKVRT